MNPFLYLVFPIVILTAACSSSDKKVETKKEEVVVKMDEKSAEEKAKTKAMLEAKIKKEKSIHWGYTGAFGPQFWGNLDGKYALCKSGKKQSPINLVWKKPEVEGSSLALNYKESKLHITDTGHGLEIQMDPGSFMNHNDKMYELKRIQFHNASEHQLSGKSFPLEMHLIHEAKDGSKAIVAVFYKSGSENVMFSKILDKLPNTKKKMHSEPGFVYTASVLLPQKLHHYNYVGSLTMPPCTEGVEWVVLNTPLEMSSSQIDKIKSVYVGNQRPIQPLNGREYSNY